MDKFMAYMKKNSSQCIFVAILLFFFVIMLILWVRHGTFSLGEDYVLLECSSVSATSETAECNLTLHYNGDVYGTDNKILSVNGHFDIPEGLEYQFVSYCGEDCAVDEHTENGFAIGKVDGLSNNWLFGKLVITVPTGLTETTNYQISLTELALSDSEYVMHDLADSTDTLTLTVEAPSSQPGSSDPEPSSDAPDPGPSSEAPDSGPSSEVTYNLTFDNTLHVANGNVKIIYNLPEGETYSYLLGKITTNYNVRIVDRNGNQISENSLLKSYESIIFTGGGEEIEYKIAVLHDINGDGEGASIADVAKLHDVYKRTGVNNYHIDDVTKYTGDINGDGTVAGLGDVAMLHNIYKSIQK